MHVFRVLLSAPNVQKKQKRYTRAQLQSLVQASDTELDAGLKERNVIQVDGTLPAFSPNQPGLLLCILRN